MKYLKLKEKETDETRARRAASRKKARGLFRFGGILLIIAAVLFSLGKILSYYQSGLEGSTAATSTPAVAGQIPGLIVNDTPVLLEIADTSALQVKGLSGRASLPLNHAMLFVFDRPDAHPIWMKDMKFSIDIFWLDNDYKILKIERNVSPNTYPKQFVSAAPASYVLETNAGFADESGLEEGMVLDIIR